MPNYNKVILVGNLTRDPELKYAPSGDAVCNFTLAINRKFKDKEETCFLDVTAWKNTAEAIAKYLHKGDPVLIEGRLKQDKWEGQDGTKRSKIGVVAERAVFLGKGESAEPPARSAPPPPTIPESDLPIIGDGDMPGDDMIPF